MLSYKRKNREREGADERNETNEKKPPGNVGGGGVLAGGLAGCGHGRGAGGLSGVAGADAGHSAGTAAPGGILAAHWLQCRAHPAGLRAGGGVQCGAGRGRRALGVGGSPARAGDAAGEGDAGGELHHFGTGVGQRKLAVGPHQLSDGAAGALRRGAHRHRERGCAAAGNGKGVPASAGSSAAGHLAPGCAAGVPAGVQRGTGHLLEERRSGGSHRPARRQHR